MDFSPELLEYVYRISHSVLRWLPTKLAEWIGKNLQEALPVGFPDKGDVRAGPGSGWTAAELNHILQAHVVDGTLTTFGCVDWEYEQFQARESRALCVPEATSSRCQRGASWHEPTGLHSNMYHYIQICTSTYQYVPVCTSMYQYVPMYTGKCTYQ